MTRLALVCLLTVVASAKALADGGMFPERTVQLTERPPSIPSQRAVLKWDGKTETLIIESVLDGPSGGYGWVVPLPAKPSFVKAVKPEYITRTFEKVKPRVLSLSNRDHQTVGLLAIFAAAVLLSSGVRHRKASPGNRLGWMLLEAFLLACFLVVNVWFDPSDARNAAKSGATESAAAEGGASYKMAQPEVNVTNYGTIGSYEVSALSSESSKPIMDWLRDHNIDVPEQAASVIDQYAEEGWCFLAASFRKATDRPLPPHPLKAVFDTEKPVYPMRLTATMNQPVHLELVVVGGRRAEIEGMRVWKADNYGLEIEVRKDPQEDKGLFDEWKGTRYAMAKFGVAYTFLRGDIQPSQMNRDFDVSWKPYTGFTLEVFDFDQSSNRAWLYFWFGVPVFALIFGVLPTLWEKRHIAIPIAVALTLLAAAVPPQNWLRSIERVETDAHSLPVDGYPEG
ncbi:MAG: DUF2330 domain-containing protein [Armatimonadetes bacterium]|nr:DUF2330 domain-containing protein [Armatimonadota bacterium]